MAFDEALAGRVRDVLSAFDKVDQVKEKKMFGGLTFMIRGNMLCGILGSELMVRVGKERYEESLSLPHTRKMDFTGREMKGIIYIENKGLDSDELLKDWIDIGLGFVNTLPSK